MKENSLFKDIVKIDSNLLLSDQSCRNIRNILNNNLLSQYFKSKACHTKPL